MITFLKKSIPLTCWIILLTVCILYNDYPNKNIAFKKKKAKVNIAHAIDSLIREPFDPNGERYASGYLIAEYQKSLENNINARTLVDSWKFLGPGNIAGRVRCLIVDPTDQSKNTWIVGTGGGGIWKTEDAGSSWKALNEQLMNLTVVSLAQSSTNPDVLFAGTGEQGLRGSGRRGTGLYQSLNNGQTWQRVIYPSDHLNVNRIHINPADGNEMLIAVSSSNGGAILKTKDGGKTWKTCFDIRKPVHQIISHPNNFNVQYATMRVGGIIKSEDSGDTWQILAGLPESIKLARRIELAISPQDENYIYASLADVPLANEDPETKYNVTDKLFFSRDAGKNWQEVKDKSRTSNYRYLKQGTYDNAIVVHPFNKKVVFWGGVSIWKVILPDEEQDKNKDIQGIIQQVSSFKPESNVPNDYRNIHADHHGLYTLTRTNNTFDIISVNDGGVAIRENGNTLFVEVGDQGIQNTQFYTVDKVPRLPAYIGGTQDNGVLKSFGSLNNKGAKFGVIATGDGFDLALHPNNTEGIFSIQYNTLYGFSTSFIMPVNIPISEVTPESSPFFTKIGYTRQNPNTVFIVDRAGVWRSEDFGRTWAVSDKNLGSHSGWGWAKGHSLEVSPAQPKYVWVGGGLNAIRTVFVSKDTGTTFKPVSLFTRDMGNLTDIIAHPEKPNTAFLLFSQKGSPKILMTEDLGKSWKDLSGFDGGNVSKNGFPDVVVYTFLPFPDGTFWAGTELGIFESKDQGNSWTRPSSNLPNVQIYQLKAREKKIMAATHGRGLWSLDVPWEYTTPSITAIDKPSIEKPVVRVYPNPVSTDLYVETETIAVANVRLIHISSQQVFSFQKNSKLLKINVESMPSGVYLVQTENNQKSQTTKIIKF